MATHRLSPVELRVLGCLIEKQRTTPEQYPLTLNALRLACNQATNREPVLELDESQVRSAAQHLGTLGWARLATGPGSRTAKYRQLFGEALDLMPAEVSILAVLMLRGPQTVSELKTRTERLHRFASNDDLTQTLTRLDEKELAHLLPRQPGQREERWTHLLADGPTGAGPIDEPDVAAAEPSTLERRLERVEAKLAELEQALAERDLL
ncbi:MAG: YceH family protein [Gaiellaceae bacterium]